MDATEPRTPLDELGVAQSRPAVERLFSLSGALPLPALLLLHLAHELSLAFAEDVRELVRAPRTPFEDGARLVFVIAPLCVHAGLGSYFLLSQRRLQRPAEAEKSWARGAIRVSGFLTLLFVGYHAYDLSLPRWLGQRDASDAGFMLVERLAGTAAGAPIAALLYLFGLLVSIAHSAIGVHRALVAEGWSRSERSRRRSARYAALGAALAFVVGAAAVLRVATGRLP